MGAEIMFGSTDAALAKEIEERLGDNTVASLSKNRPRFFAGLNPSKQSESEHLHRRPLMLDQEFMKLPPDEQIILRPGMDPARTKRMRWFQIQEFVQLKRRPPPVPLLSLSVETDDGAGRVVNISNE
jgi:type IV secretory pathway TraG/TraD family ATPase VirD4